MNRVNVAQPEQMRVDAVRNREHILQVAHDAFAESGTASLNAIAKRAGVGPGTLYRHFPTREALVLAVYQRDVQRLLDSVGEEIAGREPLDAFRIWFRRLAGYVRLKHGLGDALQSAAVQDAINETYVPITVAVQTLMDACVAAGSMRPGLDPEDVLALLSCLWRVGDGSAEQLDRRLDLAIQGMRG